MESFKQCQQGGRYAMMILPAGQKHKDALGKAVLYKACARLRGRQCVQGEAPSSSGR